MNKKILTAVATTLCLSIFATSAVNADIFLGMDAVHGDPTISETDISLTSASDVARIYPNGSYYSVNRKACTCHVANHEPSSNCNCGRYNYYCNGYNNSNGYAVAYQCNGFARYCYNEYNGIDVPYYESNWTIKKDLSTCTDDDFSDLLSDIGPQAYLRGQTANGTFHSIFYVGYDQISKKITILHANYPGSCVVESKSLSKEEFLQRFRYLDWFYTSDGSLGKVNSKGGIDYVKLNF